MPGDGAVGAYAVVDVAVEDQQGQHQQHVGDVNAAVEVGSIVMLNHPGDRHEPAHPDRNPQAVPEVVGRDTNRRSVGRSP